MGLGLSVVRGFVTQSGGRVALSSSAGRGTVVRIQFPKAPDPLPAAAMDPDDARPFVLAVDDEAPLRFVLQRLIQRLGLGVAVAGSSAEALAVLRSRRVDLLVTDVVLGGGDSGAELARLARTLRPSLPVVYVSGYTREELDLGALSPRDWFVAKPFVNAEFSLAVTEAVAVAGGAARKRA